MEQLGSFENKILNIFLDKSLSILNYEDGTKKGPRIINVCMNIFLEQKKQDFQKGSATKLLQQRA